MRFPSWSPAVLPELGLYIHWPFCQAKCPYCDFNSHVVAQVDHSSWRAAYRNEIKRWAKKKPDHVVSSIFFGGGTPSLMEPQTVEVVIETIRASWRTRNDVEITLEANPTSVEADRFRAYRNAGVNRVSMGIQALNDTDLKRLGRLHSVAEARAAFDIARKSFDRVSFDLIYARQDQRLDDWRIELADALLMNADHMSLYQLTIEDETTFGDRFAKGTLRGLPSEDLAADLYEVTQELCEEAGLPAYEVSNHAADGQESRHNLIYWRGGEYIGIGPGAHGRVLENEVWYATEAQSAPLHWLSAVQSKSADHVTPLTNQERWEERLMMGLRLAEGIQLMDDAYRQIPRLEEKINELKGMELIISNGSILRATRKGRPLLNGILRILLA